MKGKCTIDNPNRSTKQFLKSRLPQRIKLWHITSGYFFSCDVNIKKKSRSKNIVYAIGF